MASFLSPTLLPSCCWQEPELPHKDGELLRPAVVWFNEGLDPRTMDAAYEALDDCDMFLVSTFWEGGQSDADTHWLIDLVITHPISISLYEWQVAGTSSVV